MEEQIKYFFGDREVLFREPTDGQVAALTKFVSIGKRNSQEIERVVVATGRILEVIDHLIVNDEDRNWLEDQLVAGKLSAEDLIKPLANLVNGASEEAPTPKSRARRGR